MKVDVKVPTVGESITEGRLIEWFRADGDIVGIDDPLFDLETDKITMQVQAECAGRLSIAVAAGQEVSVGQVVGAIDLACWLDYRDYCLCSVLYWCGLRRGELCALEVTDVDMSSRLLTVRAGKGGRGRLVPIDHDLLGAVPVCGMYHWSFLFAFAQRNPVQRRQDNRHFQRLDMQPPVDGPQPVIQR